MQRLCRPQDRLELDFELAVPASTHPLLMDLTYRMNQDGLNLVETLVLEALDET